MIYRDFPETVGKKALVLISGGMDSRVCLQKAVRELGAENVVAACTFYGQKHSIELQYAEEAASALGVKFHLVDLSSVFSFNKNSSALLKGSSRRIDHTSYADQMKEKLEKGEALVSSQMVPFRNGLFLSYATALALQFGCNYVVYGAHSDDSNVEFTDQDGNIRKACAYPDCSSFFIEAMGKAIFEGTGGIVKLVAPIYDLTKSEVAQLGVSLGMSKEDFKHTWSCYEGGPQECGTCGTCRDKIKALRSINFTDEDLREMFEEVF